MNTIRYIGIQFVPTTLLRDIEIRAIGISFQRSGDYTIINLK